LLEVLSSTDLQTVASHTSIEEDNLIEKHFPIKGANGWLNSASWQGTSSYAQHLVQSPAKHPLKSDQSLVEFSDTIAKGEFPVKRTRFSENQIIKILREAEAGVPVTDLCRTHGFSRSSFYIWKARHGGMEASDLRRPNPT
jgi:hypothetical protein